MSLDVKWIECAPEKVEAGMLIVWSTGFIEMIGSDYDPFQDYEYRHIIRWAWLIKPHELKWVASMAKAVVL